ncbi:MAG: hypothetical protein CL454_08890 [Acidimicrobiaceae bacterium]|nr:hypothetical protein [Acidimicrobiaceae bacterium]
MLFSYPRFVVFNRKNETSQGNFFTDLPKGLILITFGRFISNIAYRLVFPFLPTISRGLGVSTGAMGTALAMRDLVEVSSPLVGRMSDRRGTTQTMVAGICGLGMATALQGASSGLILFIFALVLASVSKNSFDIGSSSWTGSSVPFSNRSRAIGLIETTWALSFIIGMPVAAVLIQAGTWRTPFLVTAILCIVTGIIFHIFIPKSPRRTEILLPSRLSPTARHALLGMVALGCGHMMMLVTFAAFLEDEHGLSTSGLGFIALTIGVAELVGSGTVTLFGDRFGKIKVVKFALLLSLPLSISLPVGEASIWVALLLISLWFACTESVIVSMLSTCTELDRKARGTMMGFVYAGWALGRFFGAIVGAMVYQNYGMRPLSIIMTTVLCLALMIILKAFGISGELEDKDLSLQ